MIKYIDVNIYLGNQLFMQNQLNDFGGRLDSIEGRLDTMENRMDLMQEQIDNNHREITRRLDKLEANQEAMKRFMIESDRSFQKSEEAIG